MRYRPVTAVVLVVADDARHALQSAVHGEVHAAGDEAARESKKLQFSGAGKKGHPGEMAP